MKLGLVLQNDEVILPVLDLELDMKNVTNVLNPVSVWYKLGVHLGVLDYESCDVLADAVMQSNE